MKDYRFARFDRSRLTIRPLKDRQHDLDISVIKDLAIRPVENQDFALIAKKITRAADSGAAVVLMIGAHVLRAGVQRYIIDLLERGLVSCIATNGAAVIHDYEFSLIGKTTESVAKYIENGQFGLWSELGRINKVVKDGADSDLGIGEAVGCEIASNNYPYKEISLFAAAYRLNIPITVHVGIGYDIVYEHPDADGGAWGKSSYIDFLIFTKVLEKLSQGVIMNFGSAVMGPEIFLKALAMVRNLAAQHGGKIDGFSTLVCDIKSLPDGYQREVCRSDPQYYFRPWKTMLVRALSGAGESCYIRGDHAETVPELWNAIIDLEEV